MKAKEYFDKYGPAIADPENLGLNPLHDLVQALSDEQLSIMKSRHIVTEKAASALIGEFNQKWNAIVRLFEKKFGVSPIKKDGWELLMERRIDRAMEERILGNKGDESVEIAEKFGFGIPKEDK